MQVFKGIDSFTDIGQTTVTVGSFDGVHSGHIALLSLLRQRAQAEGRKSVVVSFSPHPRITLGRSEGLQLLTSDQEKAELIACQGIDALLLIEFTHEFSRLSYEEFLVEHLQKRVGMAELVAGFNHQMGHNGGGFDKLQRTALEHNFSISMAVEHSQAGDKVSSTAIRRLIAQGDIQSANRLLSHPYLIIGSSDNNGQLTIDQRLKLIPPQGRYLSEVNDQRGHITIDGEQHIWCDEHNKQLEIKLLGKDEK